MMADTMQRSENPHEQLVRELSEAASSTPRWIASASKLGQDRPAPRVDAAPRRPPARTIEWSALGEGSGAFARRGELVAELHEACTVEGGRTAANAPPVSIRARGSAIGADGAFALAQCLAVCAPLELVQLDVSKAALGDEGVHALASLFCTAHAPAVRVLTLSLAVNGLTSESGPALAAVIAPQARPLGGSDGGGRGVRELLLAHNTLGDSGCAHLAAGLARAGCGVTRLSLASNAIGDAGASALVDALPSVPSLTALDLADNGLTARGVRMLARVLPRTAVRELRIGGHPIEMAGDTGADEHAPALWRDFAACATLRRLHVDRCALGLSAVGHLLPMLVEPACTLVELSLVGNRMSLQAARDLLAVSGIEHTQDSGGSHAFRLVRRTAAAAQPAAAATTPTGGNGARGSQRTVATEQGRLDCCRVLF